MTQLTPLQSFPWHASRKSVYVSDIHNRVVAEVFDRPGKEDAARLLGAAPIMLDGLRVALGHLTGGMDGDWRDCDPVAVIRAAIECATGSHGESQSPPQSFVDAKKEREEGWPELSSDT